jgi:hypothetical protein
MFFAQRGYVFVFQDVRGRHESEGKWEPFRNDIEGRLRHDRVGGGTAVVKRQGGYGGRLLPRARAVARRDGAGRRT